MKPFALLLVTLVSFSASAQWSIQDLIWPAAEFKKVHETESEISCSYALEQYPSPQSGDLLLMEDLKARSASTINKFAHSARSRSALSSDLQAELSLLNKELSDLEAKFDFDDLEARGLMTSLGTITSILNYNGYVPRRRDLDFLVGVLETQLTVTEQSDAPSQERLSEVRWNLSVLQQLVSLYNLVEPNTPFPEPKMDELTERFFAFK